MEIQRIFNQGDTIDIPYQLWKDKDAEIAWDLTDCKIRFELKVDNGLKKATVNVSGATAEEIIITSAKTGEFLVNIKASESKSLPLGKYNYFIQIETPEHKKFTIIKDFIEIIEAGIIWETK